MKYVSLAPLGLALIIATTSPGFASCTRASAASLRSLTDSFKNRPDGLLERFVDGENGLTFDIKQVVSADVNQFLKPVLDILRIANLKQRRAIGAGLAQASQSCRMNGDSQLATRIGDELRKRGIQDAMASFNLTMSPPSLPPSIIPSDLNRQGSRSALPDPSKSGIQPLNDVTRPIQPIR